MSLYLVTHTDDDGNNCDYFVHADSTSDPFRQALELWAEEILDGKSDFQELTGRDVRGADVTVFEVPTSPMRHQVVWWNSLEHRHYKFIR